ncbi:MAG: molecular chaperone HtpG [Nitrospirae bacterium]|nr:MAG: molecular chaperone HtpG [Nitrospirota bacterium]
MTVQQMEFKTEVKQLLDLMIHSLYSHKEIFLRELISNASDALDKARYESLTNSSLQEKAGDWTIRIIADRAAGTLSVSDNGIGMTRDEIIEALGTIAHSGTKEFLKAMQGSEKKDMPELIGQFGVGFYSSFMVADKVTVLSKKAGTDGLGVRWESTADGAYTLEEIEKKEAGTEVLLHLKADEKKYAEEWELREVVKKYSDYIEYPIVMKVERQKPDAFDKEKTITVEEDETLNSQKAIWLKDKADITEDAYAEFYKHLSHDFNAPAKVLHYKAEGTSEFTALLFIPSKLPLGIFYKDYKMGPTLYVRRVQIMDHCEELIPPYLRFVKGVIDSSDLPLNVSREMLQSNRQIGVIRKNITKKILDALADMKRDEYEKYTAFHREFGRVLKEGIHFDYERREQIADLLLFPSTRTAAGSFTTLQDYLSQMKEGQEDIYYITGTSLPEVLKSPHLEVFREKEYEVLVLLDDIDDMIMAGLREYKGKKIKSVIKGDIKLDVPDGAEQKKAAEEFEGLLAAIREHLKADVKEVRLSGRLKDSPCCLVMDESGLDPNMEKLMKAMGQEVPVNLRILEINPGHQLFGVMRSMVPDDQRRELLGEYIDMVYNQALLLEGSPLKDPAGFARSIARLMTEQGSRRP